MLNRIVAVVTLRAPIYRDIADDRTATGKAALIVVVVSLIVGFIAGYSEASAAGVEVVPAAIVGALSQLVAALIAWAIGSWITAFVAKIVFHGRTNTLEMLRVFGYTWIFRIIGFIPVVGIPVGVVLSIIGNTIGIREAAGLDLTRAILTSLVSGVIIFIIIVAVISFLIAALVAIGLTAGAVPM